MPKVPSPYLDAPRLAEGDSLDLRTHFGAPVVELEIGPGRGSFLFERARAVPNHFIVGLEVRKKWAKIVDERLLEAGLHSRARVFAEDARLVLPRLQSESLGAIFIHFPDPWWKKRHQKRMVIDPLSLAQMARVLRAGGDLYIQTDVEERAVAYRAQLEQVSVFLPFEHADPTGSPFGAESPREKRAKADGLPIYRLWYQKK